MYTRNASTYILSVFVLTVALLATGCGSDGPTVSYEEIDLEGVLTHIDDLSDAEIDNSDGNRIPVGTVMVYRTSDNHLGKMVVVQNDGSNNNGLTINHVIYDMDESVIAEAEGEQIAGTFSYALDGSADDFWLQNVTETERNVTPQNGAVFATIGMDPTFE